MAVPTGWGSVWSVWRVWSGLSPVVVLVVCMLGLLGACGDRTGTDASAAAPWRPRDSWKAELEPLPPPPPTQLLDDGRIFAEAAEDLEELVRYLRNLKEEGGIEIFVALYGFLSGETVEERAHRLREAWAHHDRKGVVVVYERGGGGLSFVATDDMDDLLTRHDVDVIMRRAGVAAQGETGARAQVRAAVFTLGDALVDKVDRRRRADDLLGRKRMLVFASTLACIVLVTLLGVVLSRWMRRADRRASEFYYFPAARVSTRYGAPFSGGVGAGMRFK